MTTDPATLIADPAWFFDNIDLQSGNATFLKVNRDQLENTPFLDERLDRNGLEEARAPLGALANLKTAPAATPVFIWHTAFCGSTLLARLLSAKGKSLCLREPMVLSVLASLKRHGHKDLFNSLIAPVFHSLARYSEVTIIKPTNAVNSLITDADQLFPDAKHLFLTSKPQAFMVSIAKKREEGRAFVRKLFAMFAKDGARLGAIAQEQLFSLTDLQIAALVWHMEIEEMRKAQALIGQERSAWVDGDEFLAAPTETLRAARTFFSINLDDHAIDKIATGPLMQRDSKNQDRSFSAQQRADEAEATRALLGDDLARIIEWSFAVSPETPRPNYLQHKLIAQ